LIRTGVLLVNLGTPDAPKPAEVRRYLREFLSDPRVLDLHPIGRWLLLNLVILPFRPRRSAEAYEKVWTPEGSPLLVHSRALATRLQAVLPDHPVVLAMRYGQPSLEAGLASLREARCDRVVVVPLYPQYASSSTGSTLDAVYKAAAGPWNTPYLEVVPPFYDDPAFLEVFARRAREVFARQAPDHVVMSFHGLPERHVTKSDESGRHCLASPGCCDTIVDANRNCYRAQCFATARGLASRLELTADRYSVTFQSRLGRVPWIKPYTDEVLPVLAQQGKRHLAVLCPAFVADCLETLEEIGLRAAEDWRAAGGETLSLVPSLNAEPDWVDALVGLVRPYTARE
jgi:ferrochelatase